ncbi:MAG: hypothetical protein ACOCUR_00055 [Nanoarchaeota archaeon]
MKFHAALLLMLVILSTSVLSLSISPTELQIKNIDVDKDYQFIALIANSQEGLVDVELKASENAVVISPNKFMLNKGDKRSVRVVLDTRRLDLDKERLVINAYANGILSENRLIINLDETNETKITDEETEKSTLIEDPEIMTLIIYGLLFITAIMIILIFVPEIKKSIDSAKLKTLEAGSKAHKKKFKKISSKLEKRIDVTDKRLNKLIEDVIKFHEEAHNWLKENTGGKYGLE